MKFAVVSEAESDVASDARLVAVGLTDRHGWKRVPSDDVEAAHVALVCADSVDAARSLVEVLPAELRARTVLLGIRGGMGASTIFAQPEPGTVWGLLEEWGLAAHIPRETLDHWKPRISGVIGRKDLEDHRQAGHMLAPYSRHYSFWIDTPGTDVVEFISSLAETMLAISETETGSAP